MAKKINVVEEIMNDEYLPQWKQPIKNLWTIITGKYNAEMNHIISYTAGFYDGRNVAVAILKKNKKK